MLGSDQTRLALPIPRWFYSSTPGAASSEGFPALQSVLSLTAQVACLVLCCDASVSDLAQGPDYGTQAMGGHRVNLRPSFSALEFVLILFHTEIKRCLAGLRLCQWGAGFWNRSLDSLCPRL